MTEIDFDALVNDFIDDNVVGKLLLSAVRVNVIGRVLVLRMDDCPGVDETMKLQSFKYETHPMALFIFKGIRSRYQKQIIEGTDDSFTIKKYEMVDIPKVWNA